MKKVSVIIPAYNKSNYTIRTVESVLNQDYTNIEIIVVDDGSTDDTKIRLDKYKDKIFYYYKENQGASEARNLGIKKASGDYLAFIDCDDIFYKTKISKSVEELEKNNEYGFIYTNVDQIDENDIIVGAFDEIDQYAFSGWIFKCLIKQNFICNSTLVVRKSCVNVIGFFDKKIFGPADWDFLLRLSLKFRGLYISEKLTGYRITEQTSMKILNIIVEEYLYVIKKNILLYPELDKKIKKESFFNAYYMHAKNFAAINDFKNSKILFKKALHNSNINKKYFKIIIFFILSFILPNKFLYNYFRKKQFYSK